MYNYFFVIGRITQDVEIKSTQSGKKVSNLTLAVSRPFKNTEGQYDTDFIDVTIWDAYCDAVQSYLKKGSTVAVKGRISTSKVTLESKAVINKIDLVGEKVVFISSPKTKAEEI